MLLFKIIIILLNLYYCSLLLWYRFGWKRIQKKHLEIIDNKRFSVIIAMRNEQENIPKCLQSFLEIKYPKNDFEILIIDDHSDDKSIKNVQKIISENPSFQIRLLSLPTDKFGKKSAIAFGIENSQNEIIACTDADCMVNPNWLTLLNVYFQENDTKMVTGPVSFFEEKNTWEKAQNLEFMGLVTIGAASLELGVPGTCNGANIAYRKQVFWDVNGYQNNEHIASGDDEFLMHKILLTGKNAVKFLKEKDAIVYTKAQENLSSFIHQRLRWVSKSTKYTLKKVTLILSFAYLYHLTFVALLIASFFNPIYIYWILVSLLLKMATELLFYAPILEFYNRKKLIKLIPLIQPFYIFYILYIGLMGNIKNYNWKNRNLK